MVIEGVDGAVVEVCAGFVQRCGGDAARQHEAHINGQPLGGLQHIVDAVRAHDIGDFVRVGNDGGRAVRQDGARELLRRDKGGFQMNMRVDKAGADDLAADIDLYLAVIAAHADDLPLCHGDIALTQFVGEDIDIGGVFKDEIGLLPAGGDIDDVLLFHQLALDPRGVGFVRDGHVASSFHYLYHAASEAALLHILVI